MAEMLEIICKIFPKRHKNHVENPMTHTITSQIRYIEPTPKSL